MKANKTRLSISFNWLIQIVQWMNMPERIFQPVVTPNTIRAGWERHN
ncbi:hypothetical protein ACAW74_00990 [Fibrella sp. WM1]